MSLKFELDNGKTKEYATCGGLSSAVSPDEIYPTKCVLIMIRRMVPVITSTALCMEAYIKQLYLLPYLSCSLLYDCYRMALRGGPSRSGSRNGGLLVILVPIIILTSGLPVKR